MEYYIIPSDPPVYVPVLPKVASVATAVAAMEYYPEIKRQMEENLIAKHLWKFFIPTTNDPQGQIYGLVRHPVDRMRSVLTIYRKSIDHEGKMFQRQEFEGAKFAYPEQIAEFEAATGLKLPVINETHDKITLTKAQEAEIRRGHKKELDAWEALR